MFRERERQYLFWAAAVLLVGCQFAVQLWFFRHYPQPILFGDPRGYFVVGARLRSALFEAWRGHPLHALSRVRGALPFAGVGLIYLPFRADRPGALEALRTVLACSNTLGVVGAGVLARRLTGSRLAFLLAVGVAILHPSFPNQTSRLYPDPVTGCTFVWAAVFYVGGIRKDSARAMVAAGFLLGLGLLIRAQLMKFVLCLLGLVLAATFKAWRRQPARGLVVGFLLGVLLLAVPWAGMTFWVGEGVDAKVVADNFAMRQLYPYGFWQFLETDGFEGPYRLRAEPFYKALEARFAGDLEAMESPVKQWLFTAQYVAERPAQSALLVLDNVYRLYDRPANPYRWAYPLPTTLQPFLHRVIAVLALASLAVIASDRPAFFGVAFVPACIAIVHGLSFPWPRYAQPALPTLIGLGATALVLLGRLLFQKSGPRGNLWLLGVAALGAALLAAGFASQNAMPAEARGLRLAGMGCVLAIPFLLGARAAPNTGVARNSALAYLVLILFCAAHAARDHRWHETDYALGGSVQGVRQEFELSADAVDELRRSQSFLVFDLTVPGGDSRGLRPTVQGLAPPEPIFAAMPLLPEGTTTGGTNPRELPQWWALPFDASTLSIDGGLLRVELSPVPGHRAFIRGDRFEDQEISYEGPSFGQWPKVVAGKLEYDGDYRISDRRPLESRATRSFVLRDGRWQRSRSMLRIRLITVSSNELNMSWEADPLPSRDAVVAFWATSRGRDHEAEFLLEGRRLFSFPLESAAAFTRDRGGARLCYQPQGIWAGGMEGLYLLGGFERPQSPQLEVRFRAGMSGESLFFSLDRRRTPEEARSELESCGFPRETTLVNGCARLHESKNKYPQDTGRWQVAHVF